jgi:hypothetical protein
VVVNGSEKNMGKKVDRVEVKLNNQGFFIGGGQVSSIK